MTNDELTEVLDSHKKWLSDEKDGVRADLSGAGLRGADLSGADLRGADLSGADLCSANLLGANLRDADLRGANLRDAGLLNANLFGADLRDAHLRGADLRDADLIRANLSGADLRDADIIGADLRNAHLSGADLSGADLRGANLYSVKGITMFCEEPYTIVLFEGFISFGCKTKTIEEWEALTEEQVQAIDGKAGFWFWKSPMFRSVLEIAKTGERQMTTSAAQAATTTERETKMKKTNKIGRSAEIFIAEEEF